MINFKNSSFEKSIVKMQDKPNAGYPEVLIVGRSNVGKSSLINALCTRHRLAYTSSKPGHTKLLNYFNIDNKFYLVDAPGYGFAKGGVDLDQLFGQMMEEYFQNNKNLALVLMLLDSRRELTDDDLEILEYIQENDLPYLLVITKADKINQKGRSALNKHLKEKKIDNESVIFTSINEPRTLTALRSAIERNV